MKKVKFFAMSSAAFLASMLLFLNGCGSSPTPRYYSLNCLSAENLRSPSQQNNNVIIASVGPVNIPEYLDRPEIVVRDERNRLKLSDFDLWASPLDNDINRVLVNNISSLLKNKGIGVVTWRAKAPVSHTISVSISRFEAAGDSVTLTAQWVITEKNEYKISVMRESVITKPLAGREHTDIIAGMSDALADLSGEIAAALKNIKISIQRQ